VKGREYPRWFRENIDPDRAAALLAEVEAMPEEERGMWAMRVFGDYDA
jgi:hypothetical protein